MKRSAAPLLATVGISASLIAAPFGTATAQSAPAPAPVPEVKWETCPATVDAPGAECGQVDVPMRYGDSNSPQISVGFVRVPAAQPAAKRGVLFGNPGGPGGDAYTYVGSDSVGFTWPKEIRNEWDMVAVQPRGLQHSTQLECEPAAPANQLDAIRSQVDNTVNAGAASRRMCQGDNPGMPESITTENNARDWDTVRRALGYDTVSIMGLSYGTYLGSAYASMFPDHTDKVVLDSAMNPDQQWNELVMEQKGGYERALHDYFDFVARNDATYRMGDTPLKAYQYWSAKVVEETGTNPTVVPPPARVGDLPPGLEFAGQAGADAITATGKARVEAEGIVSRMLKPGATQFNSQLLQQTKLGIPAPSDWDTLARMTNGTFEPKPAPPKPVIDEVMGADVARLNLLFNQACNENITQPDYSLIPQAIWSNYISQDVFASAHDLFGSGGACNGAAPVAKRIPLNGGGLKTRPLQINATGDPQTLYSGRGVIQNEMGSQLVTVHGPGHGHVALGNTAVDNIVVEYLRTGKVNQHDAPGYFDQQR
ncbi:MULTISPECIES: alpha/beta hydrolase [unclassified Corynebacterium]|uniref:alpha/beta hydrolase n=1 Tax=unclassified Corynebacterium TaxID=2624378 RepID=UPI0021AAD2D5|nr:MULTISPECIES: alpha/beta hydrolase [unclassified Corynebacterium]MCT1452449.1 alpha/beta hydrolase [Corynebacterium sp. p3-SID1145]MCT1461351.1 alpha/beta hydrolase [Corynebacterium sp. p3-SID1140]WKK63712.1 alpha/beta hydrolase [Corynebacterium sp. P8-C1]